MIYSTISVYTENYNNNYHYYYSYMYTPHTHVYTTQTDLHSVGVHYLAAGVWEQDILAAVGVMALDL